MDYNGPTKWMDRIAVVSFEADVSPDVLVWARKSIGLSLEDAAKKIGISTGDLRWWEEGPGNPTITQLRKMAEVYKRPLAVFLLPEPPRTFDVLKDFRLLQANQGRAYSSGLHLAFRRVQMQREVATEIAELEGEVPPQLDLRLDLAQDSEAAGERVRNWLEIGLLDEDDQQKDTLNFWIGLVEAKSILVTQVGGIDLEEMRGCSISDQPFPAILINGKDTRRGRVFTLMHELTHILLRSGGVCDLEDRPVPPLTDRERVERFCNRVAAAILMPRALLLHDPEVLRATPRTQWHDDDLRRLSDRFGISMEAMLLRLVTLERASWDTYNEKRPLFLKIYSKSSRLQREKSGGPSYYKMKLRDYGRRYVGIVLDAYHRGVVSGSRLAEYLDIKIDRIDKLENLLRSRS